MNAEIAGPNNRGWEMVAWGILLGVLHAPWLLGGHALDLAFLPDRVAAGAWWRVFTYPFVHVSWYHLLLDGAAFLLLWHGLRGSLASRMGTLVASVAGGLLFAAIGSAQFWTVGLCGLSGVAHGLMARQALDLWDDGRSVANRRLALGLLGAVIGKCVIEALTGTAFFSQWHLGALGTPIVICHLGGVCGAMMWWIVDVFRSAWHRLSGPRKDQPPLSPESFFDCASCRLRPHRSHMRDG